MPTGEKDENGYIHVVNVGTGITFGNMVLCKILCNRIPQRKDDRGSYETVK